MKKNSVRYSYLRQQFDDCDEILREIKALVHSGKFTLGPPVAQFEKSFAELIGTRFAIGVGSGTDALKLSLKAAGVGYGDEVITAANTFIATAGAINEIGATPVFVDATPYYTIDPSKIKAAITSKTKAIMPVHYTGEPADMIEIMAVAKEHGLAVVEDACQSILASVEGKTAGTFGVAGGFSLHPLKNLNVWGDAGIIVTNSEEMNDRLRLLRNHGLRGRDEVEIFGYNSRLDSVQAVVGNWLIKKTHEITDRRIANANRYDELFRELEGKVFMPLRRENVKRVYHLFEFEVDESVRDSLYAHLRENGVECKIHYPIPLFLQPGLKHLGYRPGDFPVTEKQAKRVLTLPVDQHLEPEQIEYCFEQVKSFFKK